MKKAVVLGIILLVLGCMAYADGVTVGLDWGRSQFNLASGSSLSGSTTNQGWQGPMGTYPAGQRVDFQLAYSNDHQAYNVTGYLFGTSMSYVNIYGTLKFIPDMFTAYIGEFNGDGWDHFRMDSDNPVYDVNNNNVGRFGGWGVILDLMPKDSGFEAALFMKTGDPTAAGAVNTLANQASQYAFAASYTVPNLVKVSAGSTTFGLWPTPQRNIFGRVQLLMVPNLTLWDDFYYAGFDMSPSITIYSDELEVTYNMKPLTIIVPVFYGQNVIQGVAGGAGGPDYTRAVNGGSDYSTWAVYPEVYYNMGSLSLGLYTGFSGTSATGGGVSYWIGPYVKLNDFNVKIAFTYAGSTVSNAPSTWEIPVTVEWGF